MSSITNEDRRRYLAAAQAQGSLTRNAHSLRPSDRIVTTLAREGLLTCAQPKPRSHMVYALTPAGKQRLADLSRKSPAPR